MPQVADLVSLQEHDDVLKRLQADLAAAQADLADESALEAAKVGAQEAAEKGEGFEHERRRLEGEIETLSAKIEKEEGRLYDGSIGLPKELAGIQKEIDSLKGRRSRWEDSELEILDALEQAEAEMTATASALAREEAASTGKGGRLATVIAGLEGEIEGVNGERSRCIERLAGPTVSQYDDLRRRKGGVAVTHVQGGACTGCRVGVPSSAQRLALDPDRLAFCPNCERILVGI